MSLPTHQQTQQHQRATTGLQLRDWLTDPDHAAESPSVPASSSSSASPSPSPSPASTSASSLAPDAPVTPGGSTATTTGTTTADQRRRSAVADAALVIPDRVRLQLDTALFGQRAPLGSTGPDGAPRSKNLTLLVGTLRTRTTRNGRSQREISDLGAVRYRYELSINELFASPTGMAYASYRFPITMTDAVLARCDDVLVDGQRVAVLGPITLDVSYDPRFQIDAYDAGLRTWTLHMDVLDVRPAADDLPDMAWVQLEGEVIDRPRIVAHRYGDRREMVERYASVSLRCRELLAGPRGVATRPVTRVVPIEVLIDPHEELISASDALLQPGNLVRVEGRFSPSTYRIRSGQRPGPGGAPDMAQPDEIAQALERTRMVITARNAELRDQGERHQEALQAAQERNRARTAAGRQPLPLPAAPLRPLSDQVLEQRIIQAQRRLLTGTRVRVEVGAVELLRGTPLSAAARAQLIADREAEERSRRERRSGGARPGEARSGGSRSGDARPGRSPREQLDADAVEAALDEATAQMMERGAVDEAVNEVTNEVTHEVADDGGALVSTPAVRSPHRPRRRAADAEPVAGTLPGVLADARPDRLPDTPADAHLDTEQ